MRLREKGAGVLEGKPLGTPSTMARQAGVSARQFKPEGGECWVDVSIRVKDFMQEVAGKHMVKKAKVSVVQPQVDGVVEEEKKESSTATTYPEGYIPRILCVTHGGLIMEFLNYVDSFLPPGVTPAEGSRTNKAKNCAIFIFQFREVAEDGHPSGFHIDSVRENDVDHLTGDSEDRGRGKGNA